MMLPTVRGFWEVEKGERGMVEEPTMRAVAEGARLRGVEEMVRAGPPGVRVWESMIRREEVGLRE